MRGYSTLICNDLVSKLGNTFHPFLIFCGLSLVPLFIFLLYVMLLSPFCSQFPVFCLIVEFHAALSEILKKLLFVCFHQDNLYHFTWYLSSTSRKCMDLVPEKFIYNIHEALYRFLSLNNSFNNTFRFLVVSIFSK